MSKPPIRREFEKIKRKGDLQKKLGGKKTNHDLHHKKMLSRGGDNSFKNIVQILTFAHALLHKYDRRGELSDLKWGKAKSPSIEKTYDIIAQGLIDKVRQDIFVRNVIMEIEFRKERA